MSTKHGVHHVLSLPGHRRPLAAAACAPLPLHVAPGLALPRRLSLPLVPFHPGLFPGLPTFRALFLPGGCRGDFRAARAVLASSGRQQVCSGDAPGPALPSGTRLTAPGPQGRVGAQPVAPGVPGPFCRALLLRASAACSFYSLLPGVPPPSFPMRGLRPCRRPAPLSCLGQDWRRWSPLGRPRCLLRLRSTSSRGTPSCPPASRPALPLGTLGTTPCVTRATSVPGDGAPVPKGGRVAPLSSLRGTVWHGDWAAQTLSVM